MRPGETDGREYRFVDDAAFDRMVDAGEFLEWAVVFGRRYGTGRSATEEVLAAGKDLLLDIDVQGARQVRERGVEAVSIFVLPPDYATLESRLRLRGSESDGEIQRRLSQARTEASEYDHYDYVVVNHDIERATKEIRAVVRAERARTDRRRAFVRKILETFPEERRDRRGLRATQE
jgi:guanylate kinase